MSSHQNQSKSYLKKLISKEDIRNLSYCQNKIKQRPKEEEFEESIRELSEYKNRLEKEVTTISEKLKMPPTKIKSIIDSHKELINIKIILSKLNKQKKNIT